MRNPYEPPSMFSGYSERHTSRPGLLAVAAFFGVIVLLMCGTFIWGVIMFLGMAEFLEAPTVILLGSTVLGGASALLSLFFLALAVRKRR
jgi:hypothetical protein